LLVLLVPWLPLQTSASPGYYPGSYYAAHVIRKGGELLPSDSTETGTRWEDYSVFRVKGDRIPAKAGHGLEVYADIYGMPAGDPVTLRVSRPVIQANGERGVHTMTRQQPLYETDSFDVQVFNYIYFLDEPDELVTGEWAIELSHGDTLILRQTFEVYADLATTKHKE